MTKKFIIRSSIIFVWVAFIFCTLYWPRWKVMQFEKHTINVFTWGDIFEPSVVADFERETGIKINFSYYSTNEEMLVKLKATKGEGYDLVIPSDYAVNALIQEDLLKKLDKSKFAYWDSINPHLLGHYFDPGNHYSIPFEWELFGFGIDKDYFHMHPIEPTWGMIFDPNIVHYKITMENDPISAVEFASFYLYGMTSQLNLDQIQGIRQLLIQQRPWVAAYASFRGDYFLATKNVSLVVASTSYILRTQKLFEFVGFVLPKEGTFISIENFCIPKPSQKEDLAFRFINYLCSPESVAAHFKTYCLFPSTLHSLENLGVDEQTAKILRSTPEDFKKYHFIQNIVPQDETRDIWVDVKSAKF